MSNPSFILVLVILLPLVPAYLLYRNLPGRAIVSGLLKGFNVKLSGGFAGYFALVLLILSTHSWWYPAKSTVPWTVTGTIHYLRGDARTLSDKTVVFPTPPPVQNSSVVDGVFSMTLKLPPDTVKSRFPTINVDARGYEPATNVDLSKREWKTRIGGNSITGRTITLETPIELRPQPQSPTPYNAKNAENPKPDGGSPQ